MSPEGLPTRPNARFTVALAIGSVNPWYKYEVNCVTFELTAL
jgi:hypothetical protein